MTKYIRLTIINYYMSNDPRKLLYLFDISLFAEQNPTETTKLEIELLSQNIQRKYVFSVTFA